MVNERHSGKRAGARGGFTLVELLVALAIFTTVMGSVTLLFNAAVRASKQGFQNQEAFEVARGVLDLIESDLHRAFTARAHDDVFNFYGTPIGFTYVGLVDAEGSASPNLARVTYVMYHEPTDTDPTGSVTTFEDVNQRPIPTYMLLRYIEPGADNLDSYPIDWSAQTVTDDPSSPTLQEIVDDFVFAATDPTGTQPLCGQLDIGCAESVERAYKRQIWMIMLSGGRDEAPPFLAIPSIWDSRIRDAVPILAGADPRDFSVAENIRHLGIVPSNLTNLADDDGDGEIDEFGEDLVDVAGIPSAFSLTPTIIPRVNETIPRVNEPANYDPASGRIPFFTYRDYGRAFIEGDPLTDQDDRFEVQPIQLRYWNDARNISSDGVNNNPSPSPNSNILIDEAGAIPGVYETNVGSPLSGVIPVSVTVDVTLFFRSVYPGAPDFNEQFTRVIDLPTGARRLFDEVTLAP